MEYFEVERPTGDGFCSDDTCPCPPPGTRIPHGSGYLYVSPEVIDFRRDALTLAAARRKLERVQHEVDAFVAFGPGTVAPILMCEQAARRRGLDLEVAAADAKYWWETGLVPLRPTPLVNGGQRARRRKRWWEFWRKGGMREGADEKRHE